MELKETLKTIGYGILVAFLIVLVWYQIDQQKNPEKQDIIQKRQEYQYTIPSIVFISDDNLVCDSQREHWIRKNLSTYISRECLNGTWDMVIQGQHWER